MPRWNAKFRHSGLEAPNKIAICMRLRTIAAIQVTKEAADPPVRMSLAVF